MSKTKRTGVFLSFMLVLLMTAGTTVYAQDVRGSIRGTVRLDTNSDGRCAEGTPVVGIPIEFISNDEKTIVYLQSGDDGTYGLVAAGLGTWQVSARPAVEYRVTSAKTIPTFLDDSQRLALNVDFCVAATPGGAAGTPALLPQSGGQRPAGSPVTLALLLTTGIAFIAAGTALEWRRIRPVD